MLPYRLQVHTHPGQEVFRLSDVHPEPYTTHTVPLMLERRLQKITAACSLVSLLLMLVATCSPPKHPKLESKCEIVTATPKQVYNGLDRWTLRLIKEQLW